MKLVNFISNFFICGFFFGSSLLGFSSDFFPSQESISCDVSFLDSLERGRFKCYSYLADPNDKIRIRAIGTNNLRLKAILFDPDGNKVGEWSASGNNKALEADTVLSMMGSYSIRIEDIGNENFGLFGFSFQKINNCPQIEIVEYGTPKFGTIESIGQMKAYRFRGMPGEAIHISFGELGHIWPEMKLYDPTGKLLKTDQPGSKHTAARIDTLLDLEGFYTVLLMDREGDVVDLDNHFSLTLQLINDPLRKQLILDTTVCSSLPYPGVSRPYTFKGMAGDEITLRLGVKSGIDARVDLYDPGGRFERRQESPPFPARIDLELDSSGSYTVLVMDRDGNNVDENIAFGLSLQKRNNEVAQILTDTIIRDTFSKLGQIDVYSFLGREDEIVTVTLQGASPYKAELEVYDPSGFLLGANVAENSQGAAQIDIPVEEEGVYTIFVMDEQGNDFSLENPYTLEISGIGAAIRLSHTPKLCSEDTYTFKGEIFNINRHSGTVSWPAQVMGDPDTVLSVSLSFYQPAINFVQITMCLGQDTLIGGQIFDQNQTLDTLLLENAGFFGCDSTIIVELEYDLGCQVSQAELIIPKVFTPNEDGVNDEFEIPLLATAPTQYPNSRLVIYNRFKVKVFENSNYENGRQWDGRDQYSGKLLPVGTYHYVFILGEADANIHTGTITIMR